MKKIKKKINLMNFLMPNEISKFKLKNIKIMNLIKRKKYRIFNSN